MVAETSLSVDDLIWPVFVCEGEGKTEDIPSMPDVKRYSIDLLTEQVKKAASLGIPAIAIFPATPAELKDETASEAINPDNLVCRAVREIKQTVPQIGIICDVALDPYTSHGHDGLVENNHVTNDKTVEILCEQALIQAQAGCDIIAPSDMMDGRVGAIRDILDSNNFQHVRIMSYAAKYASAFYGPFRDAVGASAGLGNSGKATYQMDPANSDEAVREVALDIAEGADMVIIKPGLPYLDIINKIKNYYKIPVFAYQVSGEYAMIKSAISNGWLEGSVIYESLLSIKRAGASGILTYFALQIAEVLKDENTAGQL